VTPVGISNIQWRYYLIYAVLNAAFVVVVQLFYVETAKLSLEGIDNLFERGIAFDAEEAHAEKGPQVVHVDDNSNNSARK
jgi:hypothetical protein